MSVSSCLPHKRAFSHVCDGCFLIEFLHRNRSLPSPMAHSTRCAISSSPDLYIFSASLHSCISLLLLFPVTSSAGHFFSTLHLLCSRFSPVHFFSSVCFRSSLFISVNTNNNPLACMQFPLARVVKQDMDGRRSVYLSIWLHGRVRCTNKQTMLKAALKSVYVYTANPGLRWHRAGKASNLTVADNAALLLKKGRLIFPGNFALKPPRTFATGILNSGGFLPQKHQPAMTAIQNLDPNPNGTVSRTVPPLPTCQFPGLRLPPFRPRVLNLLLVITAVCLIEQLLQLLNTLLVNGKVGKTWWSTLPCLNKLSLLKTHDKAADLASFLGSLGGVTRWAMSKPLWLVSLLVGCGHSLSPQYI